MRIWPEYIDLNYFAAQLVEEYPNQFMPTLLKDEDWPDWAAAVSATNLFSKANVPSPYTIKNNKKENTFASWQEWAKAAYICINAFEPNINNAG